MLNGPSKLFIENDPLHGLHRQTRDSRRYALTGMLENALTNAHATACDNFVWTLRRAMLILKSRDGKQVSREIWGLKDLPSMVTYWDCHVAKGNEIPKLNSLLCNGFRNRSYFMDTLDWKVEWQGKCRIALQDCEHPSLQKCLNDVPVIIEAADIVAEFIENKCTCKNVYKSYKSVEWLDRPPEESEALMDLDKL